MSSSASPSAIPRFGTPMRLTTTTFPPDPQGLPDDRKHKHRPPMWDSNLHGEPGGRFKPKAASRSAAGAVHEPVDPDAAWACEDALKKMRNAVAKRREQHRREIDVVAAAFVAHAGGPAHPGKCDRAQFRAAWASLGVKDLSDEEVAAVFSRMGVDSNGLMPCDVFTRALAMGAGRAAGMEAIKKGPFIDAKDADFLGKVTYPQCRRGVNTPTEWLASAKEITRRSASEPAASLALDFVNGLPGASTGNALKVTPCGKIVYYVAALGVVYDRTTHRQRFFAGHDDDVRSIAQHPDGYTFATGQDGAKPSALVWSCKREARDPVDIPCAQLARVADAEGYMRSFVALAFDATGDVLVAMGSDNRHTATLWAWRNKRDQAPLASVPTIQGVVPAVWGVAVNPRAHVSAKHRPRDGSPDPSKTGEFITFGDKHVKVWRKDKTSGIWGGKLASFSDTKAFGVNSAVYLPVKGEDKAPRVLAGTSDGRLAIFDLRANKLVKLIRAHEDLGRAPSMRKPGLANTKGIRALLLLEEDNVLVTGGADGRVITWALTDDGDDVVGKVDEIVLQSPMGPGAPPPMIRSLAVAVEPEPDVEEPASEMSTGTKSGTDVTAKVGAAEEGNGKKARTGPVKFYVGTDQCDLWEVTATSVRILIAGSGSALNDVAWNPTVPHVCATIGEDGWVKLWNAEKRAQFAVRDLGAGVSSTKSSGGGKSLHFSPDGKLLAAGLGDGRVVVMDARSLARLAEAQAGGGGLLNPAVGVDHKPGGRVAAVKFSPDSTLLACAGADRSVHIFANVDGRFAPTATCAGHSTTVVALDWTEDSRILRSVCANHEMLHWSAPSGKPFKGDVRDFNWHTHNSPVGFPVMGVWEEGKAGPRHINSVDRSSDRGHMVAGDDAGIVRLLHYPCVARGAGSARFRGHSSHVSAVRFSADDAWVASTGSVDNSLLVWRVRGMKGTRDVNGPIA